MLVRIFKNKVVAIELLIMPETLSRKIDEWVKPERTNQHVPEQVQPKMALFDMLFFMLKN